MSLENCYGNRCEEGSVLRKEQFMYSAGNGKYTLTLRNSGNLELLCANTLIWASNTFDEQIYDLYIGRGSVRLRLPSSRKSILAEKLFYDKLSNSYYLSLQDDGNVVYHKIQKTWTTENIVLDSLDTYGKCIYGKNIVLFKLHQTTSKNYDFWLISGD